MGAWFQKFKKKRRKKAADNSFPVSKSVFHLTFSNKREPFPMSSLKYARKKETMRDCHRLYNKMKIESTCSYEKINLYSYQIYEVFISALPLSLEHMNTHLKR